VNSRTRTTLVLGLSGLVLVGAIVAMVSGLKEASKEPTYKDKPVSKWFCDQRKDFLSKTTRDAADDAFNALGTNALPFLLSNLKNRGSTVLYFRLYGAVPSRVQAWLPYPILGDDMKMITLNHLSKMRDMPPEWLAALAKLVPDLKNPRVRQRGLITVQILAQGRRDTSLISLCKDLLDDSNFGVRLRAAILLAELEPGETGSFPILIGALEDKEKLNSRRAISSYRYRQPPSGAGPPTKLFPSGLTPNDLEKAERRQVIGALERLMPKLDEQQKKLVRQHEGH